MIGNFRCIRERMIGVSMIPDVRHRTDEFNHLYNPDQHKDEINPYWQGFMDDSGVSKMIGYDLATEKAICFFDNLDAYGCNLDEDTIQKLKESISQCLESGRDELGTSIIDAMDDDDYHMIREQVESGNRNNYCTDMRDEG